MAKKTPSAPVVDVTENPEAVQLIEQAAPIRAFMADAQRFVTLAKDLEDSALATLEVAKALTVPTTATADADIQTFVQKANFAKKTVETHWGICAAVSAFHKRLTGRRARSTEALENAVLIATRLHNQYADNERRRAREEEERLYRENEARAREEREAEARRLEEAALEAEAASGDLSARERLFVDDSFDREEADAWQAARRAGYKNPQQAAQRLLGLAKINEAIRAKVDAAHARQQAAVVREQPLQVEQVEVPANIIQVASERTTWSAELYSEGEFIAWIVKATIEGNTSAPVDCLQINRVKLNEYARSMHKLIDRWPGVRAKENRGIR